MIQQFLVNPDGSIPEGVDVEVLRAQGIPLVIPTERWVPQAGMGLEEREPEERDGIWYQVWVEAPIPEPAADAPGEAAGAEGTT